MDNYEVSVTKVFGVAVTHTATIQANDLAEAQDNAKDIVGWTEVYNSITQSNMSDSYEFAEIVIDGKVVEHTLFNNKLLNEAIKINKNEGRYPHDNYD